VLNVSELYFSIVAAAGKQMTDKFKVMLRAISKRLDDEPAHQPILQQLSVLLHSPQPSLRDANLLGRLLSDAGMLDEAKEFYEEVTEHIPDKPLGSVGMAQVAMQRGEWQEALTWWDEVIARFGDKPAASWLGGQATALMELGRFEEAETVFLGLTRDFKNESPGFVGLARLAMLRRLWTDALRLWEQVLTRFANESKSHWHYWHANTLAHLDRLDEAENIFQRLAEDFPTQSLGFIGLAGIAMKRHAWQAALVRWEEVMTRFAGTAHTNWQVSRAQILKELGRGEEAEAALRQIVRLNPESLDALIALVRVLIGKGNPEKAAQEVESPLFRTAEVPATVEVKFEILIGLKRFDEARTEFERLLQKTNDPAILDSLFTYTASIHNGWRRTETWITLLRKVESLSSLSNSSPANPGLHARILLALRDYRSFLALLSETRERDLGEHWRGLLAVASKLRGTSFPDYYAPKIFGIGLSKTGTTSLAAALTALGFYTLDWFNPLTRKLMSDDDLHLFEAFTDTPVCANFEKYYFMFPNSKFVYTVRPFESWKESIENHGLRFYGHRNFEDARKGVAHSDTVHFGVDFSNIFSSLYFNHKSYEDAYHVYDQRVRRFFQDKPKDRFLEFDVAAGGWAELCAFTDRPKPSTPFPWLNRKP
jgi:tetratricopeptide (TPR) repeat protein